MRTEPTEVDGRLESASGDADVGAEAQEHRLAGRRVDGRRLTRATEPSRQQTGIHRAAVSQLHVVKATADHVTQTNRPDDDDDDDDDDYRQFVSFFSLRLSHV